MSYIERIKEIEKAEGLSREELAMKCGMKYTRLRNVIGGQAEVRASDLAVIASAFPEYEVWLFTGKEYPNEGQISPITKITLGELGTQRKAE
ncbi:helix-turn-helix domain-containing protein [Cellvibrio fontiphilus]|uniref:Helix-turn-helix domain-containing protein n=1 Tax=Cellvibrio fontiphilus TaxID=1815559 RepID=A0ABV7FEC7_9GAMM